MEAHDSVSLSLAINGDGVPLLRSQLLRNVGRCPFSLLHKAQFEKDSISGGRRHPEVNRSRLARLLAYLIVERNACGLELVCERHLEKRG